MSYRGTLKPLKEKSKRNNPTAGDFKAVFETFQMSVSKTKAEKKKTLFVLKYGNNTLLLSKPVLIYKIKIIWSAPSKMDAAEFSICEHYAEQRLTFSLLTTLEILSPDSSMGCRSLRNVRLQLSQAKQPMDSGTLVP